jgi:hypothetical protein
MWARNCFYYCNTYLKIQMISYRLFALEVTENNPSLSPFSIAGRYNEWMDSFLCTTNVGTGASGSLETKWIMVINSTEYSVLE